MNSSEISIITKRLEALKQSKLDSIGREYGNIWICFVDNLGNSFILLMQTIFRFCNTDEILITDLDKYKVSDSFKLSPFYEDEQYDWHIQGSNKFDEWIANNKKDLLSNLTVQDVKINNFGDLSILFNCDITLTLYLEVTANVECWRFFVKDAEKIQDLIVYGSRVIAPDDE